MKVIRSENQLKMVGKAWEIKYKLKELSKLSGSVSTVKQYLDLFQQG